MTTDPACTVVIPFYRGLGDLARAVDSVLAQSFVDFEIIVVANGVSDGLWTEARLLRTDPRLRTIRLAEAGVSRARNAGLDAARGDLVFFLDGDDRFHPEKLARFVAFRREVGFDVAFSRGLRQRGGGVSWPFPIEAWDGREPLSEFLFCRGNTSSSSAIVMTRSAGRTVRFETPPPYEDPGLLLCAAARGLTVRMLPDILYDWFDDRDANRLSRMVDVEARLAWIDLPDLAATPKAKAAYRARAVGQHVFPGRFVQSLLFFFEAVRLGAVRPVEVCLFIFRGLVPTGLRARALNVFFLLRATRGRQVPEA